MVKIKGGKSELIAWLMKLWFGKLVIASPCMRPVSEGQEFLKLKY